MSTATYRQIGGPQGLIARQEPFTGNSMSAVRGAVSRLGYLPEKYRGIYGADHATGMIAYTVLSYDTPIAWVRTDGTVVKPDVKYSVTTSRHQGLTGWLKSENPWKTYWTYPAEIHALDVKHMLTVNHSHDWEVRVVEVSDGFAVQWRKIA